MPHEPTKQETKVALRFCTFECGDGKTRVDLDPGIVNAIRTRKIGGPRNPHKTRLLGHIGEFLVHPLLEHAGFTGVVRLPQNHPAFDFTAERKNQKYFISVKTRNKFQRDGTLNSGYKLESKYRKVGDAIKEASEGNALFAWVTVQIDKATYCAYFGTHEMLGEKFPKSSGRSVPMTERATGHYLPLALNKRHDLPSVLFSN